MAVRLDFIDTYCSSDWSVKALFTSAKVAWQLLTEWNFKCWIQDWGSFFMWLLAAFHTHEKFSSEYMLATFPWAYNDLARIFAAYGLAGYCVLLCSVWIARVSNLFMYASKKQFGLCDWSISCHAAVAVGSWQAKSKHQCLVSKQVFSHPTVLSNLHQVFPTWTWCCVQGLK